MSRRPVGPDDARCDGCEAARARIGHEALLVVPEPWKRLTEHPRLRAVLPPRPQDGGVMFCARCDRLWLVTWDQYGATFFTVALDPAYAALFEPELSLELIRPLLDRDEYAHGLVSEVLEVARIDGTAAARMVVRALGARDLTYGRAMHLLHDLRGVLRNPGLRDRPRPAIRLDDAAPLVALLGRDFSDTHSSASRLELRHELDEMVRRMFAAAGDRDGPDFVAMPTRARDQLLRLTGHEPHGRPARPRPERSADDDEAARLDAALEEMRDRPSRAPADAVPPAPAPPATTSERRRVWRPPSGRHPSGRAKPGSPRVQWTLAETIGVFALPPLGVGLVLVFGVFMGELGIPTGEWRDTILLILPLVAVMAVALRLCHVGGLETGIVFAAAVGAGVLGWGHYVAYDWHGGAWAAQVYERRGVSVKGVPHATLRTRFIRETLGEPNARAGFWDLLRVRARVGVDVRRRGGRVESRQGWELWLGWAGQIVIVMGGAGLGGTLGTAWAVTSKERR